MICNFCDGSGEGMVDGSTCSECKGNGEVTENEEDEEDEEDDQDEEYERWKDNQREED